MKLPIMLLTYGNLSNKKVFSYELNGVHTLPVFHSLEPAYMFADDMQQILEEYGDNRTLQVQICDSIKNARSILITLSTIAPDLLKVAFNPPKTGRDAIDGSCIKDMEEVIEDVEIAFAQLENFNSKQK